MRNSLDEKLKQKFDSDLPDLSGSDHTDHVSVLDITHADTISTDETVDVSAPHLEVVPTFGAPGTRISLGESGEEMEEAIILEAQKDETGKVLAVRLDKVGVATGDQLYIQGEAGRSFYSGFKVSGVETIPGGSTWVHVEPSEELVLEDSGNNPAKSTWGHEGSLEEEEEVGTPSKLTATEIENLTSDKDVALKDEYLGKENNKQDEAVVDSVKQEILTASGNLQDKKDITEFILDLANKVQNQNKGKVEMDKNNRFHTLIGEFPIINEKDEKLASVQLLKDDSGNYYIIPRF